jgi:3-deoxy-manno-octulosonate cytidylyltransferase (CMP-KDO synthetase)
MKILGIIPARMAATRFPNKPMANLLGIPMIGHCYHRSKFCTLIDELFVATCDIEIYDYIKKIGGNAIMTSNKHERATERTAEALLNIEQIIPNKKFDIVVMIQGDEPLVDPRMIEEVIDPLITSGKSISNLMSILKTKEEIENPNNIKVVVSKKNNALYMSREAIPSNLKYTKDIVYFRQLGLIAFTRESLMNFVSLQTTTLENIESVDMNRLLENDIPIYMKKTCLESDSVDDKIDLARVQEKMKNDRLFNVYKNLIK